MNWRTLKPHSIISSTEDEAAISLEEGRHHSASSVPSSEYATQVTGSPGTETVTPSPALAAVQPEFADAVRKIIRLLEGMIGDGGHEGSAAPDTDETKYAPNAKILEVYNEQIAIVDTASVANANANLDVLLIFVGLFSAVVTAILIQSSQALSPDPVSISNSLLYELVSLQRAQANGTSFDSIPMADMSFTADLGDIVVNGLWSVILSFSLSIAFVAGIAKQWMQRYASPILGSNYERACTRQSRFAEFRIYFRIITFLPTALYLGLFLFMIGLSTSVYEFSFITGCITTSITAGLGIFYLLTNRAVQQKIRNRYRNAKSWGSAETAEQKAQKGLALENIAREWLKSNKPDLFAEAIKAKRTVA